MKNRMQQAIAHLETVIEPATNARTSTLTPTTWPRNTVKTIETRKRDVVIRVADWTRDTHEPAYDVEVYVRGVYDQHESASFTRWQIQHAQPGRPNGRPWKIKARVQAMEFARTQLAKHLA